MSSVSGTSPRTDTQTCTVRRHHTFEEPKNPELNGARLGVDLAPWRRSFSERIPRSTALSVTGEAIHVGTTTSSADALRESPITPRTVDFARKNRKNSTVIAQTVDGDVIVELTGVEDDHLVEGRSASEQSIHHEEGAGSVSPQSQVRGGSAGLDETTHLRVNTCPSSPEYRTFDSDGHPCHPRTS